MRSVKYLVVGLGNLPYPQTRHSIGHLILDGISSQLRAPLTSEMKGYYAETQIEMDSGSAVPIALYKPRDLMNVCGPAIVNVLRKTSVAPNSLIVIHDSLDHLPGNISPKTGGSPNGHNGVKSIIAALGSQQFHRLRVGIGRPEAGVKDYVLGRLPSFDRQYATGDGVYDALRHIRTIVEKTGR